MGSLMCEIRKTGRIELVDGVLELRQDKDGKNELIGRIVIGIDGLYVDGVEPIFCQRDDPAKLRLASRYYPQHGADADGLNGVISINRLRDDDRMEERVQLQGGAVSDWRQHPGTERGEFRIAVRASDKQHGEDTAFIATTAYHPEQKLWTGAANFLGWLWKLANPGEGPVPPPQATYPAVPEIHQLTAPGRETTLELQGDGNFVIYDIRPGLTIAGQPHASVALWGTLQGGRIRDWREDKAYPK